MNIEPVLAVGSTLFVVENMILLGAYIAYKKIVPGVCTDFGDIVRAPLFGKKKHKPKAMSDEDAYLKEQEERR